MTHTFEPQIGAIYDHLYANAEVRTPSAIAREVMKLLHTGIFLEQSSTPAAPGYRLTKGERQGLAAGDPARILSYADTVRHAYQRMRQATGLYPDGEPLQLSDFDLAFSCLKLDGISLASHDRDIIGDAVEMFRSYWSKSHGGQFFTDPKVTRLAMTLLAFDPFAGDNLGDICAGSGGFLLAAISHAQALALRPECRHRNLPDVLRQSLFGQEADAEIRDFGNDALTTRTGSDLRVISRANSLVELLSATGGTLNGLSFDCLATNPPFGSKITVKDPAILNRFELGKLGKNGTRPVAPDVLFIERNLSLLKPGGRLAIVLPYQLLSGPQAEPIRKWFLHKAHIRAVVDLPDHTFQPYTGTKASLVLMVRKSRDDEPPPARVFLSVPRDIGHDRRGNPVYTPSGPDASATNPRTDMPDVETAYREFLAGRDPSRAHPSSHAISYDRFLNGHNSRIDAKYHIPGPAEDAPRLPQAPRTVASTPLRELVKRIFFPARGKRAYVASGPDAVPFLGGSHITEFFLTTDKWISCDNPHTRQFLVREGWLLVTRSGSTGIVSRVPKSWDGHAISEHVIRIVPDDAKIPGGFLLAFLRTDAARAYLKRGIFGSVIDEISAEYLGDMPVPLPPEPVIREVAHITDQAESWRDLAMTGITRATALVEGAI